MENYNLVMEKTLEKLKAKTKKPTLLLHSCCAPCSSSVIERLKGYFDITVYYYNPNLDGEEEFVLRSTEQKRLCSLMGVNYLEDGYMQENFAKNILGLEREKEGGARCTACFKLRLARTADKAKELNMDYFATTLTVSPLKNAQMLNQIGILEQERTGINYLPSDFKKKGGYLRSIELSKTYQLYRQNYCGCKYSKTEG